MNVYDFLLDEDRLNQSKGMGVFSLTDGKRWHQKTCPAMGRRCSSVSAAGLEIKWEEQKMSHWQSYVLSQMGIEYSFKTERKMTGRGIRCRAVMWNRENLLLMRWFGRWRKKPAWRSCERKFKLVSSERRNWRCEEYVLSIESPLSARSEAANLETLSRIKEKICKSGSNIWNSSKVGGLNEGNKGNH